MALQSSPSSTPAFPFQRGAREKYDLRVPGLDILRARELAAKMNAGRDLENEPQRTVKAGQLIAASLLDEIFAAAILRYQEEVEAAALERAPAYLEENLGAPSVQTLLDALHNDFDAPPSRPAALEYLLRLRLANANPALQVFNELFDDAPLPQALYGGAMAVLHAYFDTLPPFGQDDFNLIDFLFTPLRLYPESIEAQLRFILEQWGDIAAPFLARLLTHLDILAEENKPIFHGPGPALVPDYRRAVGQEEFEAFSPDREWMPNVVMMAKNAYVWLDQLSKKTGTHVYRLDQVPDEELDEMAARGFTGLWLIGLWQRSKASQRIKQMCGNPDAVASAYSLHAYDIAWELGGQEAMDNLCSRAAKRGIRMASDMVPNHMAIDSRWVVEHPDWFISLPHSPYPQYSFEGPDLSEDERVSLFLENHYYTQNDAAVVFRRVDKQSGEERYIYHGNDGTSMPWNDTAQLNYLKAEVREAVIQTILHVARQFPIIRFDAAMTLAKRHYHRLWFPAPGEGGAIPTRAGQGLTPDEFDAAMPQEFWREVVDRVAQEVPDTLLLAEAFWMMEGYFVRTLGMHRVYNSAFMNMLRDEKNAEYRLTLKNTLEFDRDILNRFVNFMNNPDEKTAVEQFGKGDKYFGVCTLLATLPGLPMFGHGQIEGYAEKYGMEYPRAYWDEQPDQGFIAYHERAIFPLLHRRPIFAGSENFTLFDFWTEDGVVNEDVFAYSNRLGDQKALVLYHNRFADAAGWIKSSVGFAQKGAGGEKTIVQRSLDQALGLTSGEKTWYIFRDNAKELEYLRRGRDIREHGLFIQLGAYGCHVFMDWREIHDTSGLYERLAARLEGQGVASVEIALRELILEPLRNAFRPVADTGLWLRLLSPSKASKSSKSTAPVLDELEEKLFAFGQAAREFCSLPGDEAAFARETRARVERVLLLLKPTKDRDHVPNSVLDDPIAPGVLLGWALLSQLGLLDGSNEVASRSRVWMDEWLLGSMVQTALEDSGLDGPTAARAITLIQLLTAHAVAEEHTPFPLISALLADEGVQRLLRINRFEGVTYFFREAFEEILDWLELAASIEPTPFPSAEIKEMAAQSGYRVVKLLELARGISK